jgi:hypothetical protein
MSARVVELHNIMPIDNIKSVLEHGILCHEEAARLPHADVSMAAVQDRRDLVSVPGGLRLHQYANLYFDARNPMMFKRNGQAHSLCVLAVSTSIFKLKGVVITDQNASSKYVRFYAPDYIKALDFEKIYADDWRHENQIDYWRHKSAKCAEVLVPRVIPVKYVIKAYVASCVAEERLKETGFQQPIELNPRLFFREVG